MKNTHTKTQTKPIILFVALALGILSGVASAQQAARTPVAENSYVRDARGNVPMSGYGLCWHTGFPPASPTYTAGCDAAPAEQLIPVAMVAPVAVAEAAPAPKRAEMAAAPAAPVAVVAQKLTFDADTLFDSGKSTLRPAGRAALDDFVYRIKDINPEAIMTVGHADRLGSTSDNQRLSEERSESVKAYLVGVGIAPGRVHTSGKGETQPVTFAGECLSSNSAKAIACRQPDRRVDIELIGARIPQ